MVPFTNVFRHYLRKYIPQLHNKDVNTYEESIALVHQLLQERNMFDPGRKGRKYEIPIKEAIDNANKVMGPVKEQFIEVQRLYTARRKVALSGGKFQQIPASFGEFVRFPWELTKIRGREVLVVGRLLGGRIKNAFTEPTIPKVVMGTVMAGVLSFSIFSFNNASKEYQPDEIADQQPTPPSRAVEARVLPVDVKVDEKNGATQTIITTRTIVTTSTQTTTEAVADTIPPAASGEKVAGKK